MMWRFKRNLASFCVSRKLPNYPSPNPTLALWTKCWVRGGVGGEFPRNAIWSATSLAVFSRGASYIKYSSIWVSYIHNFIFIFPGYITNQFNDQLPVGLLAQLVRALHRHRRGQGSSPGKPDFFKLSFRNCISCVNNCEDLLYIYFLNKEYFLNM